VTVVVLDGGVVATLDDGVPATLAGDPLLELPQAARVRPMTSVVSANQRELLFDTGDASILRGCVRDGRKRPSH
jgi:hypothetical protein